jgi:tRNA 2-thiouridine synthesizing protein A
MAMEADITPNVTVDALGLYCPMPIIMTAKEIKKIAVGQVLAVLSDDAGIEADLPAWCKTTGNELLGLTHEGTIYTGLVRRAK